MMESSFLPDDTIIWVAELITDYGSTKEPTRIFVSAPNLVLAHNAALIWGQEVINGDILVKSVRLVTDCILDGRV